MLVVPSKERSEFPARDSLALRNHDPASRLVFHGPDEALDNGNAPMLPDSMPDTDAAHTLAESDRFVTTSRRMFQLVTAPRSKTPGEGLI
jgi:hypothetical protein